MNTLIFTKINCKTYKQTTKYKTHCNQLQDYLQLQRMHPSLGQARLLESRVVFLEQSLRQITKKVTYSSPTKNIQIEHNTIAIQNKQSHLQDLIQNLSLQIKELQLHKSIHSQQLSGHEQNQRLSDITPLHNMASNYTNSKENSSKSLNSGPNAQMLQLFQTLQSQTIKNLQQVDSKITLSHEQLESKCSKMQLRMLNIWKQAQTLLQNLTFQIQANQLKTKTIQDKIHRNRDIITNTITSFEDQLHSISLVKNNQFSQDLSSLRASLQTQLKALSDKVQAMDVQHILDSNKTQFNTMIKKNNDKIMQRVNTLIQENLKNSSTFDSNLKTITKIQKLQKDLEDHKLKLKDLQKQLKEDHKLKLKDLQKYLKDRVPARENWRNKFKQNTHENYQKNQSNSPSKQSEKFISLQNSQGPEDPWLSNSIEMGSKNVDIKNDMQHDYNKRLPSSSNNGSKASSNPIRMINPREHMVNPLDRGQIINPLDRGKMVNPLDRGFSGKKVPPMNNEQQQQVINQAPQLFGRGIAGLRSMKKKEEEKKSSLSRGKNSLYEQPKSLYSNNNHNNHNDLRSIGQSHKPNASNNLRQLPGPQSPGKMQSNKALPPLSSQKSLNKRPQMQRQQQRISQYQNYASTPQNDSDGQDSYYVDEEGFLIDKDGNRVVNQEGEEIQLSYEDIERLRDMQN